ncbi:MAG: hypothetical protein R3D30_13005 [Hyphomicrobiales bacterium]
MTTQHRARRWAWVTGTLVTTLSLGFIAALLWSQRETILSYRPGLSDILILLVGSLSYAGAGLLLISAWHSLLTWSGEKDVDRKVARRIYARTQLGKYVPGNVVQFLSRHLAGRGAGWSHLGMLLSTIFELLSLLCVAAAFVIAGLLVTSVHISAIRPPVLIAVLVGLVGLGFLVLRIVPQLVMRYWPEVATRLANRRISSLWPVAALHAGFFLIGGLLLVLVSYVVLGRPVALSYWPALISLFAAGWIVGAVTPGAPSGLGVRETVLVLGLATVASAAEAVVIAALLRVLTVLGDVLLYLFSLGKVWEFGQKAPDAETARPNGGHQRRR